MIRTYLKNLYQRTMQEAYAYAIDAVCSALGLSGRILDCGAGTGHIYETLKQRIGLTQDRYTGLEWSPEAVEEGVSKGLDIRQADLNHPLPFAEGEFHCVLALSVLEHLLRPCRFLREAQRVLEPGGILVILTPNISTYFTTVLILAGKMPSSGPHPDSDALLKQEEIFKVSDDNLQTDADCDIPRHRHLVVFSYRVLRRYLKMLKFQEVEGRGFGLYPFPNFMQPILERLDPWHCHQMVFVAIR